MNNYTQPSLFPEWEQAQKQIAREGFKPADYSKVFVSFSGGKDSVATYILATQVFAKSQIELIFTDTGDEAPETYAYCAWFSANIHPIKRYATQVLEDTGNRRRKLASIEIGWDVDKVEFAEKYQTVFNEIRYRHAGNPTVPPFPANGIRFCTKTLKVRNFERIIKALYPTRADRATILVAIGLRQLESDNRADTPYFANDLDNGWMIWYPVFDYTTAQVFDLHTRHHIPINPVYTYRERSNCLGCPFAGAKEIQSTVAKHGVEIMQGWLDLEQETGYTWANGYSMADVVTGANVTADKEAVSCLSGYCEI